MESRVWDDGVWKVERDGLGGFEAPPSLRMITMPSLVVVADYQRIPRYAVGCMKEMCSPLAMRQHPVEFEGPVVL